MLQIVKEELKELIGGQTPLLHVSEISQDPAEARQIVSEPKEPQAALVPLQ